MDIVQDLLITRKCLSPGEVAVYEARAVLLQAHTLFPRGRGCPEGAGEGSKARCVLSRRMVGQASGRNLVYNHRLFFAQLFEA
jgi:hypothetical protein